MKKFGKSKVMKKMIALTVMTVFMAGASMSAYAQGKETADEAIEYIIPADQVDQSRKRVICLTEDGAKTTHNIDWNVPAGRYYMTNCFHVDKDDYVSIAAAVTPGNVTIRVGVEYPDLSEHYINVTGGGSHGFQADRSGQYRVFVENISDVDIRITALYVY